jgi:hypothetical protein
MTKGRINARLTPPLADKVAAIRSRTGKSTTEVIVEALNRYHAELERQDGDPADILARAGFIGSATGRRDLSRRYKSELTVSLSKKA